MAVIQHVRVQGKIHLALRHCNVRIHDIQFCIFCLLLEPNFSQALPGDASSEMSMELFDVVLENHH